MTDDSVQRIGMDMMELIDRILKKFREEYSMKPSISDITNLIAKRVNENDLF